MVNKIKDFIVKVRDIFPAYNARTPNYNTKYGLFVFKGSYRQIGRQYATAMPMSHNLCKTRRYLGKLDNDSRQKLNIEIDKAKHFLRESFPEMLEMMNGVCDAYPQYDLNEVVLLNYCTTLMDWQLFSSCSSIAFLSNGKPVVGQNLDLGRSSRCGVAYIIPEGGNALFVHANPGFLWFSTGVNEHGLCITGSSVNAKARHHISGDYFPQEMLDFFILSNARDVDGAYRCLTDLLRLSPLHGGINFILTDKNGRVMNIEANGDIFSLNDTNSTAWITTNHFRTEQLSCMNRRSDKVCIQLEDNSVARYQEARAWSARGALNTSLLRTFLCQVGYPGAWWRTAFPPDAGYTTASYIIDFDAGNFEYRVEPQKRYYSIPLTIVYGRKPV